MAPTRPEQRSDSVETITRAVAVYCVENELKIRCNSLHPSGFDTPMVRNVRDPAAELASAPAASLGDPADIAQAVLFLISDESRYINGVALSGVR